MLKKTMILLTFAAMIAGCENDLMKPSESGSSSSGGGLWNLGGEQKFKEETPQQTILLQFFDGPEHVNRAVTQKNYLADTLNWKDVYVVHEENHSILYMGNYGDAKSAQTDLMKAKTFTMTNGMQPFSKAIVTAKPGSEDEGPAEWNLKNAKGFYSVLVDIQYDVPQKGYFGRKQRAVMDCRNLRKQGYDAYFIHDPYKSGVAVGTFPETSIEKRMVKVKHPVTHSEFEVEKNIIVDPKMQQIFKDFPEMLICGNTETSIEVYYDKNGQAKRKAVIQEPYPIIIPSAGNKKIMKDRELKENERNSGNRSNPGGSNNNIRLW